MKLRREESSDGSTQGQQGSTSEQEEAQKKKVKERKIRLLNRRAFQIFIKLSNGQIQAKWVTPFTTIEQIDRTVQKQNP
eukprot:6952391-Karenia_brevis.AAC.1